MTGPEHEPAKTILENAGFVVIKAKSYRAAQERQRIAEALLVAEVEHSKGTYAWANRCCDEERRLRDRLTFVYGVARALGASIEDLSQVRR